MTDNIKFTLDGVEVEAKPGESIWTVASRNNVKIPHLCHSPTMGYRPDGNCRACMVEVEGERVLAASCVRKPTAGMKVKSASERAKSARKMVFELLLADQPARETAHDPDSDFWTTVSDAGVTQSRFEARMAPVADPSHPAMRVNLDACIQCNLCVRACREIQVNDVIGMAGRGHNEKIVFDFDDPMGNSTCVACGECVQACPTGALMPATLLDMAGVKVASEDRKVDSVCPYCGVGCQLTYNIKDDKLLYVEGKRGPANEKRLCVKGRFGFDYVHSPERLTKPLIRKPGVKKHADDVITYENISEYFREATWDEALQVAANGLTHIRDTHGGNALAGFGSAKCSNEEAYLFQKLIRVGFETNNVDHCTRLCHASSVSALFEGIGTAAVTAPFTAAKDADVIIVIGSNPTENHPVAATFFKQAVKRGAKLIVMDPRGHALKRHATHMLQFKPNKDVALLNAMLHVIVGEELYDRQYVQAHTADFDQLREHVKAFSPEKMEPECGIAASTIREVARLYARSEASIIFWGMGISQSIHGTNNARCLIALALTTGQVGRPGTGLHPLRGQNNVQGASDAGLIPMFLPDYQSVENDAIRGKYEKLWGAKIQPKRGLTVVEIMNAINADQIHGMYIMGENPAMSDPDAHHAREALAKLKHLVVQDIFLTETAYYADVILPASAWPEKDGTVTNTNRQVQMGRTALPKPGEARDDWWITIELAKGMGLKWTYAHPRDVFAEMVQAMPSLANITWDRLMKEDVVTYPSSSPDDPGADIVFGDGLFPTPNQRGKLVPALYSGPGEPVDAEYPMVLTTGRQLEHWHTGAMTRRATVLDAIEPAAMACLSPKDMRSLGVRGGDTIKVETRRGAIELTVRIDEAIPSGMVFIPFCYAEAAANLLTSPQLDPFGKIPEFKYCAARVAKVEQAVAAE